MITFEIVSLEKGFWKVTGSIEPLEPALTWALALQYIEQGGKNCWIWADSSIKWAGMGKNVKFEQVLLNKQGGILIKNKRMSRS